MTFLKRPNYITYGDNYEIAEIFCKICGAAIGGLTSKMIGRRLDPATKKWIETEEVRFRRFGNYAELKIEFEDGSAHVTNGCSKCMHENLTPEELDALHQADLSVDKTEYPGRDLHLGRKAKGVLGIRNDGGGLL
jgi:hypothetical protein